jgi:hypothetical protein
VAGRNEAEERVESMLESEWDIEEQSSCGRKEEKKEKKDEEKLISKLSLFESHKINSSSKKKRNPRRCKR